LRILQSGWSEFSLHELKKVGGGCLNFAGSPSIGFGQNDLRVEMV